MRLNPGTRSFSIEGTFQGRTVTVTWRKGRIEGDAEAVACIHQLVDQCAEIIGPVPSAFQAALTPSWLAGMTVFDVFDDDARVTEGRLSDPPWHADPPGTIY